MSTGGSGKTKPTTPSPISGDLNRQVSFLMNSFVYRETPGEDNNPGIMIPRYKALGRMSPSGKRYPDKPLASGNEDDLVPVRSIISKNQGNLHEVTPDLIGTKFKDLTDGAAIGISFATSITENITQLILGLKHGGHERVMLKEGYLMAPRKCQFRDEGKWFYLYYKGGELKYPRPENLVTTGKTDLEKGDLVGTAYNTTSPIYKLNALVELMRARGSKGKRYFEKDYIIVSECYAYTDGVIRYVEGAWGEIEVWIGDIKYDYSPNCMYYYPEGTEIKKFQRFCSGVVNMNRVTARLKDDISSAYAIFRKQFYTLVDPEYLEKGVSSLISTQEELIELLFAALIKKHLNPEQPGKIENIEFMGTQKGNTNKDSFYTALSFGYASRIINKALKGDNNMAPDVMTDTILGLLLNNKLDDAATKK